MLQEQHVSQMSGHPCSLYVSKELLSSIEASFAELPDLDIPDVPKVQGSHMPPGVKLHWHVCYAALLSCLLLISEFEVPEAHLTVFGMLMLHAVCSACWRACLVMSLRWTWILWSNTKVKFLPL